ncbi:hypothetical protein Sinac_2690 [Singulisphaera acidiphila DSM 18658]|uniref:Uncharacterized protein n=1 Tax=Singulisphaera acidiphila (strain ATCC BAA-1392 / DSM 18658 / VKM B-2454 / MOB10) TaxID=886293 RepID=L0DDT5_SINAD|nr:hypothetical protein Sinac_2690 [Singulisphaera acidiphila DSM 18658]
MVTMGNMIRCTSCGQPIDPVSGPCLNCGVVSEDDVVSWVTGADEPGKVRTERTCPACGYEGDFSVGPDTSFCPACLAEYPKFLNESVSSLKQVVHCPSCNLAIGISDQDRDKTIICSRCKYFLGCVFKTNRHTRSENTRRKP